MYTDDNGIVRFESLDNIAPLQVGLNAALESVSEAFDASTRIWPVANASERDALGTGAPMDPIYVHRADTGNLERNTGNGWEIVVQGPIGWDYLPARIASGRVDITPSAANTPTSRTVTFPAGRFTAAPDVIVAPITSVPGSTVLGAGHTGASASSCSVWLTRTNTTSTSVAWVAIQA